ncbi:hypothetical protein IWX90DRAFT_143075 [Phyllosticta citrichinensis]|uniref:PH domain-containing protein n=1 Tax=Phyllosticta citrichinensis TaxID=1130410 RepID=A0ABR1XYT6_9PEZI
MAAADPQRPQAPFRLSRYRSLRKPILPPKDDTSEEPPLPPMPPLPDQTSTATATLSRTMSRYHRQRPPAAQTAPPPPLPTAVARARTQRSQPLPSARSRSANLPAGPQAAPSRDNENNDRQYAEAAREEAMRMLEGGGPSPATLKAEKRAKLEEAERLKAKQIADEHKRRKAERIRKYNEKQAEDLRAQELRARQDAIRAEALRAQQEEEARREEMEREPRPTPRNPLARHSHSPPSTSPDSSQKRERLGLLRKRRDDSPPQPVEPPSAPRSRQVSNERADPTIKPGGGGVVPGTDAPVSAVNSGDRRVMVECNSQRILLPVTPETTCLDLIRSAANVLSEPIDPQASVMLEFFTKCGVQRPLRKYERVRDVLNSWDDDRQNNLVLIESPTGGRDHDLSVASVPEAKPVTGYSCFMHYSQKPGKWSKRWITMQTNGQITSAKNDSGKDTTVVCHMSDFDIYTPTPTQQRNIKPPKRYCFAVKSQQRSNMFESTASYVHFFSTSHKDPAADFFSSVQGWRSWYLVRVMGEGQKKPKAGDQLAHNLTSTRKVSGTHGQNQESSKALARPNTSDSSHYQIGSFKPFFDPSSFEPTSTPELNLQPKVPSPPDRIMSMRNRSHPPVSYQNNSRLNSLSANNTSSDEEGPFSSGGLLGRTYSQRQRVAAQRDAAARNAGPFADGPSLLNNLSSSVPGRSSIDEAARPQRMGSVRSTRGSAQIEAPRRTNTTRMPKPLVDLTPQYQAPPQFQKKGKGYNPGSVGNGCLIDSATSPEVAIQIPPSRDWRARTGGSGARPATSGVDRSKSIRAPGMKHGGAVGAVNNHSLVPQSDADAFTGSGLIAKASWGPTNKGAPLGRGVIDGSKAKGPLLNVSESSRFAPGSLLAGVAAQHPSAPVISRE